ncbi:MAG: MFS transporter [Prochloraceae cyanobacterium]
MNHFRKILPITFADFVVRSAYQMGKTPLLPIFAASLGANDTFLGLIVSISTCTGMVLKPLIGAFSDLFGQRLLILVGTTFFIVMPFSYQFIHTPTQLAYIRIIHGLATAIYGPVTLAYVVQQSPKYIAERLGWFSIARGAGYIVGPMAASWLLLKLEPANVYTITGFLSIFAFIPIMTMRKSVVAQESLPGHIPPQTPWFRQVWQTLRLGGRNNSTWLAGSLQAIMYVALYAVKAFLPVYAVSQEINIAMVGSLFALQEIIHLLFKPWGGRIGDRQGYILIVSVGLISLGLALSILIYTQNYFCLLVAFIVMGLAQALIVPSVIAFLSERTEHNSMGATLGFLGTLNNAGKVVGPIIAGILMNWLHYSLTFRFLGIFLVLVAIGLWISDKKIGKM